MVLGKVKNWAIFYNSAVKVDNIFKAFCKKI